jgi:hypothetical protein
MPDQSPAVPQTEALECVRMTPSWADVKARAQALGWH